jgi:hypothetical protein
MPRDTLLQDLLADPDLGAADHAAVEDHDIERLMENIVELGKKEQRWTVSNQINSAIEPNEVQQADLLELPTDPNTHDKYALVVVDLATRRVGAVAIESKSASTVALAFKKLYRDEAELADQPRGASRVAEGSLHPLAPPRRLEVDSGREFHGAVSSYFGRQGTFIRRGRPGRSKQQGIAENANQIIGKLIFAVQHARELQARRDNREWVSILPAVVRVVNQRWELYKGKIDRAAGKQQREIVAAANQRGKESLPQCTPGKGVWNGTCNIVPIGTEVHVALDRAQTALGAPLMGKPRAADLKFEARKRKVTNILLIPGREPRYFVSGIGRTTFARGELLVARSNATA